MNKVGMCTCCAFKIFFADCPQEPRLNLCTTQLLVAILGIHDPYKSIFLAHQGQYPGREDQLVSLQVHAVLVQNKTGKQREQDVRRIIALNMAQQTAELLCHGSITELSEGRAGVWPKLQIKSMSK